MSAMAFQITGISIVYSTVCSDADQRVHQSSASLAVVKRTYPWPVNSQRTINMENISIWWRHHNRPCRRSWHWVFHICMKWNSCELSIQNVYVLHFNISPFFPSLQYCVIQQCVMTHVLTYCVYLSYLVIIVSDNCKLLIDNKACD